MIDNNIIYKKKGKNKNKKKKISKKRLILLK